MLCGIAPLLLPAPSRQACGPLRTPASRGEEAAACSEKFAQKQDPCGWDPARAGEKRRRSGVVHLRPKLLSAPPSDESIRSALCLAVPAGGDVPVRSANVDFVRAVRGA